MFLLWGSSGNGKSRCFDVGLVKPVVEITETTTKKYKYFKICRITNESAFNNLYYS